MRYRNHSLRLGKDHFMVCSTICRKIATMESTLTGKMANGQGVTVVTVTPCPLACYDGSKRANNKPQAGYSHAVSDSGRKN